MKEITPLLEKLAKELGTTASYLWSVLIRQASISASIDCLQYLILAIFTYIAVKLTKMSIERADEKDWDEVWMIAPIIGWIVIGILWIVVFFCIPQTITGFINPEYWALDKILSQIKK